jgi:uncharacterized membrane protein
VSEPLETPREQALFTAERAKTFVDAVVAIAMTLLILPLLESVAEAARRHENASDWFGPHAGQIYSFLLSFFLVAMFWIGHHRLFSRVEHVSVPLLWALVGWMATIVWLPVPTAMSGQMPPGPLLFLLYIGAMVLIAIANLGVRLLLRAHPELHDIPRRNMRRGLSVEVVLVVLFSLALVLAEFTPLSYWSLLVLVLTAPVQTLVVRVFRLDRTPSSRRPS